jgi:hypothetical protein
MYDERNENFFTKCVSCVFCETINGHQVGCKLSRLDKFKNQNKAVLNDDNFYTIQTICNTCRGDAWQEANKDYNLITKVENEIKIPLSFILLNIDKTDNVLDEIAESFLQCLNQKNIKPKDIILVIKNSTIDYNELYDMLKNICGDTKFKIVRALTKQDILSYVDMGVQKTNSRYYALFDTEDRIPSNLIDVLNDLINYQLKSVSMIFPYKDYKGLIIQTSLHRIYGANRIMPIYEKIVEAAEIQGYQNNIYTWEELWKTPE